MHELVNKIRMCIIMLCTYQYKSNALVDNITSP